MNSIEQQVRQWLERIVIGLNLCPFAGAPYRNGRIRIVISHAVQAGTLLNDLRRELELIASAPATTLETTLLVVAGMLSDFDAFNMFLDEVDVCLRRDGWEGEFQVASFHPEYRFDGTTDRDPGNLTNRSPWPILHILREASIDLALAEHPDPDGIPERNIRKLSALSSDEVRELFPWLDPSKPDAPSESN